MLTTRCSVQTLVPPFSCPVSQVLMDSRGKSDEQACCSTGSRRVDLCRIGRCMARSSLWRSDRTLAPTRLCEYERIARLTWSGRLLTDSFSASLAGLLWRTILRQKGRTVTQKDFVRFNWLPMVVTMLVGCLIVAGEVCIMYKS